MNMKIQLPPPANWQDFEDLCHRLWSSIWGTNPQKNGRQGQPQCGVDIYGMPPYKSQYTGIQCKGKNNNYGTKLTINEIDTECQNATQFSPEIESFILATTSPRDKEIQKHCRALTYNKRFPFSVESWSWDDISEEIQYREDIMQFAYPEYEVERTNVCVFDSYFTLSKIDAFLNRDHIKRLIDQNAKGFLSTLVFELFDNAFRYGTATRCTLEVVDNTLQIKDNGERFNPLELTDGSGGFDTIKHAKEHLKQLSYRYTDTNNTVIVSLDAHIKSSNKYEINLNADQVIRNRCYQQDLWSIPNNVSELVINITGFAPPSGAYNLFDQLSSFLQAKEGLNITVYVTSGLFFCDQLNDRYPHIRVIER
jgi:hypothetical protein